MAKQISIPATEEALIATTLPRQMVEDMRAVSEIPQQQLNQLIHLLESERGILSNVRLEMIVKENLSDERQQRAASNVLKNLNAENLEQLFTALQIWRGLNKENSKLLSARALEALRDKLTTLVRDYDALERSRKARWLQTATGNELRSVETICDARPVYDANHQEIEGFVPVVTVKMLYLCQNGQKEVFEIVLSREELHEVIEKCQDAETKLGVLSQAIKEWEPRNGIEH